MPAAARSVEGNTCVAILHLAFELGAKDWKLGFTTGLGRAPRVRKIPAGNLASLEREIEQAKQRFGVPVHGRVVSTSDADVGDPKASGSAAAVGKPVRLDLGSKRLLRPLARHGSLPQR